MSVPVDDIIEEEEELEIRKRDTNLTCICFRESSIEYSIAIMISIIMILCAFIVFIPFFFGTLVIDSGIMVNTANNVSNFYDFLIEKEGWPTIHNCKDFLTAFFLSSMILYWLRKTRDEKEEAIRKQVQEDREFSKTIEEIERDNEINKLEILEIKKIEEVEKMEPFQPPENAIKINPLSIRVVTLYYLMVIQINLAWAGAWEILERFVVFMIEFLNWAMPNFYVTTKLFEFVGTGEQSYNIAADMLQSITTSISVIILIHINMINPPSFLIYQQSVIVIILRFIWLCLIDLGGSLATLKTDLGILGTLYPGGFYSYLFVALFGLCFLYIHDIYQVRHPRNKIQILSIGDVNKSYICLLTYMIFEWIFAFYLLVPGLLFCNIGLFCYTLALVVFHYTIEV